MYFGEEKSCKESAIGNKKKERKKERIKKEKREESKYLIGSRVVWKVGSV